MTICRRARQVPRAAPADPSSREATEPVPTPLWQLCLTPAEASIAPRQENSATLKLGKLGALCTTLPWSQLGSAPSTAGAAAQPWARISIQGLIMLVLPPRVPPVTLTGPLQHLTRLQECPQDTQTKRGHGSCAAQSPPAAPSTGHSHRGTPGDSGCVAAPQAGAGGSWGDPALAKHRPPERALRSVPSPGHSGERPGPPGAPPRSPLPSRGDAVPTRPRSVGPTPGREMPRPCVGALRLPLTTEYP